MSTVLPREEAVETIFSKILASPEASGRLSGVFYDHIDDDHRLTDNDRDHFLQVLFHAYQNGDISALLLELCGRSMFDLLREAYLIPKNFTEKQEMTVCCPKNKEVSKMPLGLIFARILTDKGFRYCT